MLLLGMYSYTSSFSCSCKQTPTSLTRFLCCSLATRTSSFFSSCIPWPELCESLFTAISWPSGRTPCMSVNLQLTKLKTLYELSVYVPPYRQHQNLLHQAYCSQKSYQSQSVKLIYQEEVNRCFQCPQHWLNLSEYSENTMRKSTSIYHK